MGLRTGSAVRCAGTAGLEPAGRPGPAKRVTAASGSILTVGRAGVGQSGGAPRAAAAGAGAGAGGAVFLRHGSERDDGDGDGDVE
ncbi:hypothetical protein EVAR_60162_1 [Eumeta japonica]|uniref:Uncharacterized protein n=1 Tax=Eumeta variegata TaxID=151549 RepID=A0A4C1SRM3_EUMVA|nr:hypothetical protein EVAR_60162_1 [Eumeta japonica]